MRPLTVCDAAIDYEEKPDRRAKEFEIPRDVA
jgi:hypothetical protein